MTQTTDEIIAVIDADLASQDTLTLALYIDLAKELVDPDYFGSLYNFAVALRACHEFELDKRQAGETGLITDRTEGRISLRYLHNLDKNSTSTFGYTKYGLKLLSLARSKRLGIDTIYTLGI